MRLSFCITGLYLFFGFSDLNAQTTPNNWAFIDSLIVKNQLLDAKKAVDSVVTNHPETVDAALQFRRSDIYYLIYNQSKDAFGIVQNEWLLTSNKSFNTALAGIYTKQRITDKQLDRLKYYVETGKKMSKTLLDKEEFNLAYNIMKEAEASDNLVVKINKVGDADPKVLYFRALTSDKAGKLQEAKKYYTMLITLKVATRDVFHGLADVHKRLNDYASAIKLLEEAVMLFPDDKDIVIDWVTFSILAEQEEYLIKVLEKIVAKDSLNPEWYFIIASVYDNLNRFTDAEHYYMESLRIDTTFVDAKYNLATLYYNQAVECNKALLADTMKLLRKDSVVQVRNGYYGKALPYFEQSREVDPVSIDKIILQLKPFKGPGG